MRKEDIIRAIALTDSISGAAWSLGISGFKLLRLCSELGVSYRKV